MLRIENLTKRYGTHTLFEGMTRTFEPGCHALMGPNGCGKSTLLALLAGVLAPDTGSIQIAGRDLAADALGAKANLAYVPDNADAYPSLSGRELLERAASTKDNSADGAFALAEQFRLIPHLDKRFEQMSFGTQKKMLLAALAIGEPAVVLADEPSNGLDAHTRRVLVDLLKTRGQTSVVLFSTHDPDFAEECAAQLVSFESLTRPHASAA